MDSQIVVKSVHKAAKNCLKRFDFDTIATLALYRRKERYCDLLVVLSSKENCRISLLLHLTSWIGF